MRARHEALCQNLLKNVFQGPQLNCRLKSQHFDPRLLVVCAEGRTRGGRVRAKVGRLQTAVGWPCVTELKYGEQFAYHIATIRQFQAAADAAHAMRHSLRDKQQPI